jgi:ABC-2 type transport system permease protein
VRQLDGIKDSIEKTLLSIERELRGNEAMFSLEIVDMKARPQRYIDFLIPGLLAFMLMNLSIAGSGFNLVEYRRRGILKRLFVTPIMPKDFIISIVLARLVIVLIQLSVVLWFALLVLDIQLTGGLVSLYGMLWQRRKDTRGNKTPCDFIYFPSINTLRCIFSNQLIARNHSTDC